MIRYALAPRWWFMHLVVAALFVGCIKLGLWQWDAGHVVDAEDSGLGGHLRNDIYAVQWWFFGAFGLWFWTRFLRDQKVADEEWHAEAARESAESPDSLTS